MDVLATVVNAAVIALVGALIAWLTSVQSRHHREDLRELRTEMNERFREQGAEIKGLRGEMNERFREQGAEIAAMRSDLTQVALAIGARTRPQTG